MSETKEGEHEEEAARLIVYRGWLERGKHVWSPFVIKLEARLRFAGVSYRTEAGSTTKAPNGKIPYVEYQGGANVDEEPASRLGDSTLIIKHLVERGTIPDINARVSPPVRAQDLAIRALLEDKLYFYHTRERWLDHYHQMREHILSALAYPLRVVLGFLISRKTTQTLHGQGTGRYTAVEISTFKHEIWDGINALLSSARRTTTVTAAAATSDDDDDDDDDDDEDEVAKKPFWLLGGETPTEADATLFGFITSVLVCTA
ncbi:MAG: hypothetical protein M1837_001618, partial [Sclerophora amabilis]